jgi:hypothetical protein
MFEHKSQRLLSRSQFFLRLLRSVLAAVGLVVVSLSLGTIGYHIFARLAWIDAMLNAAMILTGMGPVDPMRTTGAKVFATCYALFSGTIFLTLAAILFAPLIHRMIHRFHLDDVEEDDRPQGKAAPKSRVAL